MWLNLQNESSKYCFTRLVKSTSYSNCPEELLRVGPTAVLNVCNSWTTDFALYKQRVNSIKLRSLFDRVDDEDDDIFTMDDACAWILLTINISLEKKEEKTETKEGYIQQLFYIRHILFFWFLLFSSMENKIEMRNCKNVLFY